MEFSISTAAFDGHPYRDAFSAIKNLGCKYVEIALVEGYIADFVETDWNEKIASELRTEFEHYGLSCTGLSCHINLNNDEAPVYLQRRLRFANYLGAKHIIINAVQPDRLPVFLRQLGDVITLAKETDIKILFENPGDHSNNLFNSAIDFEQFLGQFDTSVFGINYDPGNFVSHRPEIDVLADTLQVLNNCICNQLHVKDVKIENQRFVFCPIGQGMIDYTKIFAHMMKMPSPPFFSLEVPLRVSRDLNGKPLRGPNIISFAIIEETLRQSVEFIKSFDRR